jgi:hypothetical protein
MCTEYLGIQADAYLTNIEAKTDGIGTITVTATTRTEAKQGQ